MNGLTQTLLKLTVPGVPDFYQGAEFWDQSLVDPDNRRPVDFARRIDALDAGEPPVALAAHWRDGRVKQAVIRQALALRRESAGFVCARRLSAAGGDGTAGSACRRLRAIARRQRIAWSWCHGSRQAARGWRYGSSSRKRAWHDTAYAFLPDVMA